MTYAVRGPLLLRANQIEKELKEVGASNHLFTIYRDIKGEQKILEIFLTETSRLFW